MNLTDIRKYCSQKSGVWEDFPFDDVTMVIKVGSKMFALISIDSDPLKISLKCDPFIAEGLREKYKAIIAGYHLNKTHWNTVTLNGSIPNKVLMNMMDESYDLVFSKLKKSEREKILRSVKNEN